MRVEMFTFLIAGAIVLGGALGVVALRNPVHNALSLVATLFGVAVLFVIQEAYFLAAIQVIVYAGAIVILFLFVIMLLGVDESEDIRVEPLTVQRPLAALVAVALAGFVGTAVIVSRNLFTPRGELLQGEDNIKELAGAVFSDYVFAFELTSVLLVIAVVGTVLLTRRPKKGSLK